MCRLYVLRKCVAMLLNKKLPLTFQVKREFEYLKICVSSKITTVTRVPPSALNELPLPSRCVEMQRFGSSIVDTETYPSNPSSPHPALPDADLPFEIAATIRYLPIWRSSCPRTIRFSHPMQTLRTVRLVQLFKNATCILLKSPQLAQIPPGHSNSQTARKNHKVFSVRVGLNSEGPGNLSHNRASSISIR